MVLIPSGSLIQRVSPLFPTQSNPRWFSSSQSSSVWVQKRIKVQLRTDHPNHGKAGQVVRVKPGHMRQRLYPAGQALYCARDGIPMHHFQPKPRPELKVPPPGLSRPLNDLLQRLGVDMEITDDELQAAQAQIDRWKHAANNPTSPPPSPSTPQGPSVTLSPPKGLGEHLERTSNAYSTQTPFLVFKRAGPENSDTLYSSIKYDELISKVIEKLDFQFETLDNPSSSLSDFLKIDACSDPIQNLDHHPLASDGDSKLALALDSASKFKPIKAIGSYLIFVSLSTSKSQDGSPHHKSYKFLINVEK